MGRRTIVIETRGDICMSDRDNPRSLVEIMNDVLSTVIRYKSRAFPKKGTPC